MFNQNGQVGKTVFEHVEEPVPVEVGVEVDVPVKRLGGNKRKIIEKHRWCIILMDFILEATHESDNV